MTGIDHQHSAAIDEAAVQIANGLRDKIDRPFLPHVKQVFGLTTSEAIEAIREAQILRAKGGANAS